MKLKCDNTETVNNTPITCSVYLYRWRVDHYPPWRPTWPCACFVLGSTTSLHLMITF